MTDHRALVERLADWREGLERLSRICAEPLCDGCVRRAEKVAVLREAADALRASDKLQWTLDNIYTVARREARRNDAGKPLRPEMWRHVLRLCEAVGSQARTVGVLREDALRAAGGATRRQERALCAACGGNGVVKIPGGVSVCNRCHGECWEPAGGPEPGRGAWPTCATCRHSANTATDGSSQCCHPVWPSLGLELVIVPGGFGCPLHEPAPPGRRDEDGGLSAMTKIPTMFERDETKKGHPVTDRIKPECQWVIDGEGTATLKMDGTNVKIKGGRLLKRQKPKDRDYDEASYVPCRRDDPADRWAYEAFDVIEQPEDGIYELLGPKVQGNPHGFVAHRLVRVAPVNFSLSVEAPRSFDGLRAFMADGFPYEGIVFHHPDGRMAKIKRRDFSLPWPLPADATRERS